MKKLAAALFLAVVLVAGAFVASRLGWVRRAPTASVAGTTERAGAATRAGTGGAGSAPAASEPGTSAQAATGAAGEAPAGSLADVRAVADGDIASMDLGGRIESATSQADDIDKYAAYAAIRLIAGRSSSNWSSPAYVTFPQDIVFSFYGHQPALVSAVIVQPDGKTPHTIEDEPSEPAWAKDVEVWVSMEGPASGFTKVAGQTLKREATEQTISFAPVEARYVKLRIVSNWGHRTFVVCRTVKIIEGKRPGYRSIIDRNPDLASLLRGEYGGTTDAAPAPAGPAPAGVHLTPEGCPVPLAATGTATQHPSHDESRNVLVVLGENGKAYLPISSAAGDRVADADTSIFGRAKFTVLRPADVRVSMLGAASGIDTVVLSQVCEPGSLPAAFRRALAPWLATGNKLILQDSDGCGGPPTAYDYLPYPFLTDNPGAGGNSGNHLLFVEENAMGNTVRNHPGFIDVGAWATGDNELGDSNTMKTWDAHWCGHLFGTNANKVAGLLEAYAHYGRGLIIYDGLDVDNAMQPAYRNLIARQLAQPFDPDNLPCSVPVGDFLITTDQRLKEQPMTPGKQYVYPLSVLPNRGYNGTVKLSVTGTPADSTLKFAFDPETVTVNATAAATFTVSTSTSTSTAPRVLAVRGMDAAGKTNVMCLQFHPRWTGRLQVVSDVPHPRKAARNLEIILDASGSMKQKLGKTTRWDTALAVLQQVVSKLPDDFKVGLRVYGHRESSRSASTCTDSELMIPVGPLDRAAVVDAANRLQPRGETPLVYSVLQTRDDLKDVGGGTVVLVTDGEESCRGDAVAAARMLKQSGVDVSLNIVGFTLTGQKVQAQLASFAGATGGRFFSAQDGNALAKAVLIAAADKFPYAIFDVSGRQVAKGEAGDAESDLPPGQYKVVAYAADQEVSLGPIDVTAGSDVTVRIAFEGDRIVLKR